MHHIGEVAVALREVEAVTHDELVGTMRSHVLRIDGGLLALNVLPQEGGDLKAKRGCGCSGSS